MLIVANVAADIISASFSSTISSLHIVKVKSDASRLMLPLTSWSTSGCGGTSTSLSLAWTLSELILDPTHMLSPVCNNTGIETSFNNNDDCRIFASSIPFSL